MDGLLTTLLVYIAGYAVLVFLAVCLATGLYYLAEVVEENTRLTKTILKITILAICALHIILVATDGLPLAQAGIGLVTHCIYATMLTTFPYISFLSLQGLSSVGAFLIDNYMWVKYFISNFSTLEDLMGIMLIMCWLVPFGFFISLAANDTVLPGGAMLPGGLAAYSGHSGVGKKRPKGTLLGLFEFLKRKKDDIIPGGRSASYRHRIE